MLMGTCHDLEELYGSDRLRDSHSVSWNVVQRPCWSAIFT